MHSAPTARSLRQPKADERQWDAECGGKDPFTSEGAAWAVLAHIKKTGAAKKTCWLNAYQCSFCGAWHLGNTRRVW